MANEKTTEGYAIAEAIEMLGTWVKYLGTGNATTSMGAIEVLAKEVKEGSERIADAINNLADAVRNRE